MIEITKRLSFIALFASGNRRPILEIDTYDMICYHIVSYRQSEIGAMEEKILDAAQALFAEQGSAFTIDDLEARTQLSRATIYRRTGGKAKLLQRLARELGEEITQPDMRQKILQAARRVFGRVGLIGATMEEIARDATVGVATVYRHFGDKESLVQAFIREQTPQATVRALTFHPTDDVSRDLNRIVGETLQFFFEQRDIIRLVFMGYEREHQYLNRLRSGSDTALGSLTAYFRSQQQAGRLRTERKADELALALIGMVMAFAVIGPLHYATTVDNYEQSADLIVDLFLNDLKSHQKGQPQ